MAISSNGIETPIHICEAGKSRLDELTFFEQNIVILLIKPTSSSANFGGFTLQKSYPPPKKREQFSFNLGGIRKHAKTSIKFVVKRINRLTPNGPYMSRTAPLTTKRCILYIYSTHKGTEYFKHALYSPFFLFKMQFVS